MVGGGFIGAVWETAGARPPVGREIVDSTPECGYAQKGIKGGTIELVSGGKPRARHSSFIEQNQHSQTCTESFSCSGERTSEVGPSVCSGAELSRDESELEPGLDESEPWFPAPFAPTPFPAYAIYFTPSPPSTHLILPSPHPHRMKEPSLDSLNSSTSNMADLDCKAGPELPADASAVALPPRESAVNAHGSTNGSAVAIVEEEAAHGAYAVPAIARHPVAALK